MFANAPCMMPLRDSHVHATRMSTVPPWPVHAAHSLLWLLIAFSPMRCSWLAEWVEDLQTRLPTFSLKGAQRPDDARGEALDRPRMIDYLLDNLPPTELKRLNEALVTAGNALGSEFIEGHVANITQVSYELIPHPNNDIMPQKSKLCSGSRTRPIHM